VLAAIPDALWLPNERIGNDQLLEDSTRLAAGLRRQGLRSGQVLICPIIQESVHFTLMQGALALCDAALLPVGPSLEPAAVRELAAHTGAHWVWDAGDAQLLATDIADQETSADWRQDPLALVVQTSGTSGGCKAAMITANALTASCQGVNARLELQSGDLWLCCLPRTHIGGLVISYRCALAGAELLLHQGFDVQRVVRDLEQHPVTHLSLVPPMLARLLDQGAPPPAHLRVVLMGGQALDAGLARRALDQGWPLHLGYGMTETCSFIASHRLEEGNDVGLLPLPGVQLDSLDCTSAPPRPLSLYGPMLMAGYANPQRRPGLGLDARGWLPTQDLACRQPDGRLRILGRADDRLVIAGVNVLPARVEQQFSACAGLAELAVVGVPDPVWGQTLALCYRGTATPETLADWSRQHLSSPERPRLFLPLCDWPLRPSGKLDRERLRALAEETRLSRA
jgi:O-succinylbenzoic acid--CoA ligase